MGSGDLRDDFGPSSGVDYRRRWWLVSCVVRRCGNSASRHVAGDDALGTFVVGKPSVEFLSLLELLLHGLIMER
jgi:hypothetical protein